MKISMRFRGARRRKHAIARAIAGVLLLVLSSCAIPDLRPPPPGPALPTNFPTNSSPPNTLENSSQLGIEEFFNDPMLGSLIDQALNGNQELLALNEEVRIASNEALARQGAYLPFVSLGTSGGFDKYSRYTLEGAGEHDDPYLPGKFFSDPLPDMMGSLNFYWALDIWRELRNGRDAALQRQRAACERRNYFVTRMIAEIAENYYGLMALDKRMETLNKIIPLQQKSYDIGKALKDAGRTTEFAVQRLLAEVRKNQSERLIVAQEIITTENRVNFILGRFPQPVERASALFLDLNLHALSAGLPAQLLEFRPDVRQAERELEAAGLDIKVAKAHFFPKLDLSAGVGYDSFDPRYLFNTPQALIANAAGNMVVPLVNKKAIQAEYMSANAKQLQSVYNYQRVVLNAFTEVVNNMTKVENYSKSIDIKKQQLEALEIASETAVKLFQNPRPGAKEGGNADYLDVLLAQRDLLEATLVLIETKREQLSAGVNAYQALGGGGNLLPCPVPDSPKKHMK